MGRDRPQPCRHRSMAVVTALLRDALEPGAVGEAIGFNNRHRVQFPPVPPHSIGPRRHFHRLENLHPAADPGQPATTKSAPDSRMLRALGHLGHEP